MRGSRDGVRQRVDLALARLPSLPSDEEATRVLLLEAAALKKRRRAELYSATSEVCWVRVIAAVLDSFVRLLSQEHRLCK